MKILSIEINNIGGIRDVNLSFDPFMNIICGPNGVGKTTILESIAHSCMHSHSILLKRHALASSGNIKCLIDDGNRNLIRELKLSNFEPNTNPHHFNESRVNKKTLYFNTLRTFRYLNLPYISRDQTREHGNIDKALANGLEIQDTKNWFANRCLFSNVDNALTENNKANLEIAKKCFSLLNDTFKYSKTDGKTFDVFVSTPNGEIWYEYLSSGFKSCLTLLFGIIKEIELRMPDSECLVEQFDGTVLIDELEMHLHPEWQIKIVSVLRKTFPSTQFIVTTHSPHIVQSADSNQIIALEVNDEGITKSRDMPNGDFGYSGWTVDEVLKDIMGMEDTLSKKMRDTLNAFQNAVDSNDIHEAKKLYESLDKLLHPANVMRKMLKIDLASVIEGDDE
ncbi:AAA family ATPase [Kluyvera cryocrescens]|uniref:AAA family ATPase n=1 Tax=Kluyvera cryocrescens TaxID=580 RepID=UPI00224B5BDE|nr:AAA family ATPase [Kluyvera cryocrescens]MCX2865995.1 AAA family ATPase [Kluyvera cryocrescens]